MTDPAQEFEQWMKEEDKRKKNIIIPMANFTMKVDRKRLPVFKEKPKLEIKQGQLNLFI